MLNVLFPVDFHQLMKGFTILLGSKGTDMEQMSMREHPISELTLEALGILVSPPFEDYAQGWSQI
jgi:hypothetical protein